MNLGLAVHLAVPAVEPGARPAERAGATLLGLHLGAVVDGEEIRLADLDHRREAVGAKIVVAVLVAGEEAEGNAVVCVEALAIGAGQAVLDRVLHPRGHERDGRNDLVEELVGAPLWLHHRKLRHDVGVRDHRVDDAAQVLRVLARHHRVDGEIEPAPGEVADGGVGLLEGVGADEQVVDLRRAAVKGQVHVAQAVAQELVDEFRVREHPPVGHEPEVHPARRGASCPAHQLLAHRDLAARQAHHRVTEARGPVDLALHLVRVAVDVAHVEGVTEGAMVVAPIADLDEGLHRVPV